jgi:putative ABC transport system permease protein
MMREFVRMGAGNLWRLKLRTGLTAAGVAIGIGAMVSMLSFAFGMQRNVVAQFRSLGLFHTLNVMPRSAGESAEFGLFRTGDPDDPDAPPIERRRHRAQEQVREMTWEESEGRAADSSAAVLDDASLRSIAAIPGVALVYPQDTFDAYVEWRGHGTDASAQTLPARFVQTRTLGHLIAGRFFTSDSAREAVVSRRLLKRLGDDPDSIVGDTLHLRVAGRALLAREFLRQTLPRMGLAPQIQALVEQMAERFLAGLGASETQVVVCGVADLSGGWGFRLQDLLVPPNVAAGLDRLSFSDPIELLARLSAPSAAGFPLAIVTVDERADHRAVREAIEAMGFRVLSFVDQFEEMRRGFLIFDAMVGVIGFIALVVASLGIVNTMVMSILERTREIGILKSLGAEDRQIRLLFLVETALIGLVGSLLGLLLGWVISRIGSLVVRRIMIAQEVPPMEMFHLPFLMILGAIAFGIGVSLAAGLYPAARAARIDPVQALRRE